MTLREQVIDALNAGTSATPNEIISNLPHGTFSDEGDAVLAERRRCAQIARDLAGGQAVMAILQSRGDHEGWHR
jgi:hypothetical protein